MNLASLWDTLVLAVCRPPRDLYAGEDDLVGGRRAGFRLGNRCASLGGSGRAGALGLPLLPAPTAQQPVPARLPHTNTAPSSALRRRYYRQDVELVGVECGCGRWRLGRRRTARLHQWPTAGVKAGLLAGMHPAVTSPPTCPPAAPQINKRGLKLHASHYRPCVVTSADGRLPAVIYCHCNSGSRRDAEEILYHLLPKSITVFALDFAVRACPAARASGQAAGTCMRTCMHPTPVTCACAERAGLLQAQARGCLGHMHLRPCVLRPARAACSRIQGSGMSEGEYVTLGAHEVEDLAAAVAYLREEGSTSTIGLWGRSMGAVTALLYSQQDPSIGGMVGAALQGPCFGPGCGLCLCWWGDA